MRHNSLSSLITIVLFFFLLGCTATDSPAEEISTNSSLEAPSSCGPSDLDCMETNGSGQSPVVDKVEVIHFHGAYQCYSCITVGDYAEETINTYFADELKTGKITFSHVNRELPENQELVDKYGAIGSSLWIGVYDGADFHKEQNINVWYKTEDKEEYLAYLKEILEKRLNGDLD